MRDEHRLLSKPEVAELLGVSTRTVERMAAAGQLNSIKVRGAVRFRMVDVLRILQGGTKA
jgi:excisionase family DNA binding protein